MKICNKGVNYILSCALFAAPIFVGTMVVHTTPVEAGVLHTIKKSTSHPSNPIPNPIPSKPISNPIPNPIPTISKGATSAGSTVATGAASAGNTVATGATSVGNTVAKGVTSATTSAGNIVNHTASSTASTLSGGTTSNVIEPTAHSVGTSLFDKTVGLGNKVTISGKPVTELKQGTQVLGYVSVVDNKIVSEENVVNGNITSSLSENGGKLIVNGTSIVGREVMVAGKVVGEEVIKDGTIVGHSVVAGGEYALNATGDIILNAFSTTRCESFVNLVNGSGKVVASTAETIADMIVPGLAALQDAGSLAKEATSRSTKMSGSTKSTFENNTNTFVKGAESLATELVTITTSLKNKTSQVSELFQADTFCHLTPADIDKKFAALGIVPGNIPFKKASILDGLFISEAAAATSETSHFYMSVNNTINAAAILGGTVTLSTVTDFRGNGGTYISVGPEFVTNAEAAVGGGASFYPMVNEESFLGWGRSVGVSLGGEVISGGFDAELDWDTAGVAAFQGFSVSVDGGASVLPGGDVEAAAEYTWRAF
jgi:hypothetical protein